VVVVLTLELPDQAAQAVEVQEVRQQQPEHLQLQILVAVVVVAVNPQRLLVMAVQA
jgi:hypothetical protein